MCLAWWRIRTSASASTRSLRTVTRSRLSVPSRLAPPRGRPAGSPSPPPTPPPAPACSCTQVTERLVPNAVLWKCRSRASSGKRNHAPRSSVCVHAGNAPDATATASSSCAWSLCATRLFSHADAPPTGPNRRCNAERSATDAAAALGSRPPSRSFDETTDSDTAEESSSTSPAAALGASARIGAGSGGPPPSPPPPRRSSSQYRDHSSVAAEPPPFARDGSGTPGTSSAFSSSSSSASIGTGSRVCSSKSSAYISASLLDETRFAAAAGAPCKSRVASAPAPHTALSRDNTAVLVSLGAVPPRSRSRSSCIGQSSGSGLAAGAGCGKGKGGGVGGVDVEISSIVDSIPAGRPVTDAS